jgi:hypothetical protein
MMSEMALVEFRGELRGQGLVVACGGFVTK